MVAILCGFKSRFPHQEHPLGCFFLFARDLNESEAPTEKACIAGEAAPNAVEHLRLRQEIDVPFSAPRAPSRVLLFVCTGLERVGSAVYAYAAE